MEAEQATEARLAALPVHAMSDHNPMHHNHQHPPATPSAVDTYSQAKVPALPEGMPEGLPPAPTELLDFTQSSADPHATQSVAYPGMHYPSQPQPEPEPEPQLQLQQQLTDVGASDTPIFDLLMASAAGSLPEGSNPQLHAQTRSSTDADATVGCPERAKLAAATAQSLMASPTHRTIIAEEQLELELDSDLRARCVVYDCSPAVTVAKHFVLATPTGAQKRLGSVWNGRS